MNAKVSRKADCSDRIADPYKPGLAVGGAQRLSDRRVPVDALGG